MSLSIPTKPLGRNGPLVPTLGFGAMGLSAFYGRTGTDTERLAILDRAYELGLRHWDTADMYMDNEDLIGLWFRTNPSKRASIFLATKFAAIVSPEGIKLRSDPEYVRQACEKSLKRLGVDFIDLYYCHRVDGVTPIEKTTKAMAELQQQVPFIIILLLHSPTFSFLT
jgi:aryl-alcohol dehydrogenase-like predicted oxidoreductase